MTDVIKTVFLIPCTAAKPSRGTMSVKDTSDQFPLWIQGLIQVDAMSNYSGWVYFRFEDTLSLLGEESKRSINFTKISGNGAVDLPVENARITRAIYTQQNLERSLL